MASALLQQLGQRLKQIREELQVRASDAAAQAEITPQYVHALERGEYNPTMDLLERLALIYQVDVADFFTFPARTKLRQQARELIRCTPNAKLTALVHAMESAIGMTYSDIERIATPKMKASSTR